MHRHLTAVSACVSLLVSVPVFGQDLAALAKKAEESRKTSTKETKVYTNADAGNVLAATATPSADKGKPAPADDPAAKTAQPPAADAGQATENQKDQAYWAEKLKTLQSQLERDMVFADAIQTRINILSADLVNNDLGQRPAIEQERNRALAELARLQKSILDDRKAIADFDDEARRAAVPPGWLR
jgi:hypothetical protein